MLNLNTRSSLLFFNKNYVFLFSSRENKSNDIKIQKNQEINTQSVNFKTISVLYLYIKYIGALK